MPTTNTLGEAARVEAFLAENCQGQELSGLLRLAKNAFDANEGTMMMAIGIVAMRMSESGKIPKKSLDEVLKVMAPA